MEQHSGVRMLGGGGAQEDCTSPKPKLNQSTYFKNISFSLNLFITKRLCCCLFTLHYRNYKVRLDCSQGCLPAWRLPTRHITIVTHPAIPLLCVNSCSTRLGYHFVVLVYSRLCVFIIRLKCYKILPLSLCCFTF